MVATDATECAKVRTQLQAFNFNVPVLTRATSRYITLLLEHAGKKHYLPQEWYWLGGGGFKQILPENVVQHPSHPGEPSEYRVEEDD